MENLSPYEQPAAFCQRGCVNEYIDHFELIAFMIPRETEALYLSYFMNGLWEEIKNWVRLLGPKTRITALTTTRNVESAIGGKTNI